MRLTKISFVIDDYGIIHQVSVEKNGNEHDIPVSRVENCEYYYQTAGLLLYILELRRKQDINTPNLFNGGV